MPAKAERWYHTTRPRASNTSTRAASHSANDGGREAVDKANTIALRQSELSASTSRPTSVTPAPTSAVVKVKGKQTSSVAKEKPDQNSVKGYLARSTSGLTALCADGRTAEESPDRLTEPPNAAGRTLKPLVDPRPPVRVDDITRIRWGDARVQHGDGARPAKRLKMTPPEPRRSPRRHLSAHRDAIQAGMKKSLKPAPPLAPKRKFCEATSEPVVQNPFSDIEFSQMSFERQPVDLAPWARMAGLKELPPRPQTALPRGRSPRTARPSPKGPPEEPLADEDQEGTNRTVDQRHDNLELGAPPSSGATTVEEEEVQAPVFRSPNRESYSLVFPDDTDRSRQVSMAVEHDELVMKPVGLIAQSHRPQRLQRVDETAHARADGDAILSSQHGETCHFAILSDSASSQQEDVASETADPAPSELGETVPQGPCRVLAPETQMPTLRAVRRESAHWQSASAAFAGAHAVPEPLVSSKAATQSRLSTYFKPDSFTKADTVAFHAISLARRTSGLRTPESHAPQPEDEVVPDSHSPRPRHQLTLDSDQMSSPLTGETTPRASVHGPVDRVLSSQRTADLEMETPAASPGTQSVTTQDVYDISAAAPVHAFDALPEDLKGWWRAM